MGERTRRALSVMLSEEERDLINRAAAKEADPQRSRHDATPSAWARRVLVEAARKAVEEGK